jgi:hypothetical protein
MSDPGKGIGDILASVKNLGLCEVFGLTPPTMSKRRISRIRPLYFPHGILVTGFAVENLKTTKGSPERGMLFPDGSGVRTSMQTLPRVPLLDMLYRFDSGDCPDQLVFSEFDPLLPQFGILGEDTPWSWLKETWGATVDADSTGEISGPRI